MANGKNTIRHWFQAGWFAFTNGYVRGYTNGKIFTGNTKVLCVPGLNCYSCPGAVGACPIGSLQAVLGSPSYKISLYVFGILALFGVLFGRLICGWMCPFGLLQDLLYKIKVKGKKKNLPGHNYLRYLKYVILVVMVVLLPMLIVNKSGLGQPWFCEWICPSGILLGGIPLTILNESLRSAIGGRFFWKLFLLLTVVFGSVWFYRPFCKYLCPLGAIYGFFNPVSGYRLVVDEDKCIKCGACQRACGMDIKTWETPNSFECIRCGDCMKACPKGAIESTWTKAKNTVVSRCFVDDTVSPSSENSLSRKTLAFGVLCIVEGLITGYIFTSTGFIKQYITKATQHNMRTVGPYTYIAPTLLLVAAMIILITGVYAIVNRNNKNALSGFRSKIGISYIFTILFIVSMVAIWFIMGESSGAANLALNILMVVGFISLLFVTPLLMSMAKSLEVGADNNGEMPKNRNTMFTVVFVITIIFMMVTCIGQAAL